MTARVTLALLGCAALVTACAFIPQRSLRLEEAQRAYAQAAADPEIARLAAAELRQAADLLEQAALARDTLDDVALVDHLAYIAKQRVAIARESARLRATRP